MYVGMTLVKILGTGREPKRKTKHLKPHSRVIIVLHSAHSRIYPYSPHPEGNENS